MMRAQDAPRKVYTRNGVTHVLFQGACFKAPRDSKINHEREVSKIEALPKVAGRARIAVTQRVAGKNHTETWVQTQVTVKHREATA